MKPCANLDLHGSRRGRNLPKRALDELSNELNLSPPRRLDIARMLVVLLWGFAALAVGASGWWIASGIGR
jgi:hypothetical protein